MHINAHLAVDVVAVETDDQVDVLLELTAPARTSAVTRPPAVLQVVLDRSGSMSGDRLEAARQALLALVDRLDPSDSFGLVVFDDEVEVVVPAGPAADRFSVKHRIAAIDTGPGAPLLLLSDGEANAGLTRPGHARTDGGFGRAAGDHDDHHRHRRRVRRGPVGVPRHRWARGPRLRGVG